MRLKVKKMKGGEDKPTKLEVIQDNPVIAKALLDFAAEKGIQAGSGMRMKGSGWWGDFVDFLKRNKIISGATKIGSYIATALGQPEIGVALNAASSAAGAFGYGMKGRGLVNQISQVGTGMVFNRGGLIQNQKTTRTMKGGRMTSAAVPTTTTYNSVYSSRSAKM